MKKRIGMVTGPSRMDDSAFVYSAWSGLRQARERFDIKASIIESEHEAHIVKHLSHFADEEYDLIWAVGYNLEEALFEVSREYDQVLFGAIDVPFAQVPQNILSIQFRENEGAFLAGYAAARMSTSGKIGFLGGFDVPLIRKFRAGFTAGAAQASAEVEIVVRYADSFISYEKGQRLAEELVNEGCDVLFHAAGAVGKGMIRKVKELEKYAIGVDLDQSFLAPNNVLTSMLKNVKETVSSAVEEFLDGRIAGGTEREFGLKEGMIDLVPIHLPSAPDSLQGEIDDLKARVVSGEISVPTE